MKDFRKFSVLTPYLAVLIGLYVFENGWLAILLYHFGISLFIFTAEHPTPIKSVFKGFNGAVAIGGVLFTTTVFPILFFLWRYMELPDQPLSSILAKYHITGASWVAFMIYFSTFQPLLEELFWRGCFQNNISSKSLAGEQSIIARTKRSFTSTFSWLDVSFAGYHLLVLALFMKLTWLPLIFIMLVITSALWRKIAQIYKGLALTIISHIAADVSIILSIHILK